MRRLYFEGTFVLMSTKGSVVYNLMDYLVIYVSVTEMSNNYLGLSIDSIAIPASPALMTVHLVLHLLVVT